MTACMILVAAIAALNVGLCLRQLGCLSAAANRPAYAMAFLRLRALQTLLQAGAGLAVLAWLAAAPMLAAPAGIAAVTGIIALQALLELAVAAGRTFDVEKRFGFNRSSPRRFAADAARLLLQRCGIALALALLAQLLLPLAAGWWWPAFALLVAVLAYPLQLLQALWLEPRRRRYVALPPCPLSQRLRDCLRRCGLQPAELLIEPGSLRSAHANARAEQAAHKRRVVLLDTLIERLPPEQVEAVVAHEAGHLVLHHLRWRHAWLCLLWAVAFALAVLAAGAAYPAAGWNHLAAVPVLLWPLRFLLQPPFNRWLRRCEYQADAFAARRVPAADLGAALRSLLQSNALAPRSDRWFAAFHESHPPLQQRLARLAAV